MTENSCRLFLRGNEYFVLCQLVTCNYAGNVNHVAIKCKVNFMYNIKNFNTHPNNQVCLDIRIFGSGSDRFLSDPDLLGLKNLYPIDT